MNIPSVKILPNTGKHTVPIQKTGGMSGIRDIGMLESAVYSAMQSFGDEEAYSTPIERAARLAYSVTMNL